MTDIVKRLRAPAYWMSGSSEGHEGENDAPREAADRIEALEAEVERLQVECAENERLWNEASNLAELNGEVADSAMKCAERLRAALRDELPRALSEVARKECCGQGNANRYSDQLECCDIPNLMVTTDQVHDAINEILASDGVDKAAGGNVTNPSEGRVIAPAADRIEELEREVWKRRLDFEEMHRDYKEMRVRVAELETGGVHTCHDECPRLPCVQAREIARLRGLIAGLITA
jgi:hypothetical protein